MAVVVPLLLLLKRTVLKKLFLAKVHTQFTKELTLASNGAKVSVGAVYLNLLTGVFEARDIVVHTPGKESWGWKSPLIMHVGYMRVEFAFLSCIPFSLVTSFLRYPAKEIYAVSVADVQVFVERRGNVMNYMLLDGMYDLPDPAGLVPERGGEVGREGGGGRGAAGTPTKDGGRPDRSEFSSPSQKPSPKSSPSPKPSLRPPLPTSPSFKAEAKATTLVRSGVASLLQAGRATEKTGSAAKGAEAAFEVQKRGFYKAFRDAQHKLESGHSLESVAAEGMAVMKKMGKAVENNFGEMRQKMEQVKNPPPVKAGYKPKVEKDLFRVGSVTIRDLRVFTRNMLARDKQPGGPPSASGWHKPIMYKEVIVGGAELSCPAGVKNGEGQPRIGMHAKEISRVMQKRMIAETGKTNSGVLLQNALGEMSDYMQDKVS